MVKERAALAGLWRTLEAAVLMFLPLVLVTSSFVFPRAAFAQFIGPPSGSPGSTAGAIGVNAAHNISVGTSTPSATSKLLIVASSSADTSNYSLQILYPNQQPVLIVRNDGSIGVGTSSPAYALDVVGSIRASGSILGSFAGTVNAQNISAGVFASSTGGGNFAFPANLGISTSSAVSLPQPLSVYGGGYLSGNVGIGTTTPAMSLDVIGTGFRSVVPSGFADVVFGTASKQWTLYPSGNDLRLFEYGSIFGSGGNDRVTFQAGGNVGIGTSSPASLFTVATSTNILNVLSSGNVGIGTTTPAYSLTVQGNAYVSGNLTCGGTGCGGQWTTTSTGIYYNGGNVGIGTTAPVGKLHVAATTGVSSPGSIALAIRDSGSPTYGFDFDLEGVSTGDLSLMRTVAGTQSQVMTFQRASGNVGIGTTAPAAKLDITGSSGQTGLRVIHATAGDTSFATAVSGDSFLRFSFLANGLMTWGGGSATADVQLLRNVSGGLAVQGLNGVSSTQAFNVLAPNGISILDVDTINQLVGVGTTTPAQALHVYKGNTATYLRVEGASDGSNFAGLELRSVEATPNMWQFVQKTNHDFKFAYFNGTSWSTPVLIQAGTGNVGIGTSAPIATLHVSGQVYSSVIGGNNFVLNTSGANYGTIANIASQQWALGWSASTSTLGTSVISWNGNGLVGIDSTAPQATLHVAGQVYANATGNNDFLLASVGSNYGTISNPSQNVWALGYGTATSSLGTSVLTWTSGGLVGIGASSPITTLHVGGQIYSSVVGGVNFVMNASGANYGNISNNSGAWSLGYSTATSTIGTAVLTWTSSNSVGVGRTPTTYAFEVQGDAGKTGGTGSWNIISDVRVKTGISGLTDAIGVINSLDPVEYHFQPWYLKEHPEVRDVPYYGFISQEFQKVFPYNVTRDQNGYLWLNDGSVAPYLVAATQEFSRVIKVDDSGNLVLASANGRVTVNGGLQVASDSPRPPCDSSTRGTFRVAKSSGAPGTSDKVEVCLWSNDSYQWRLVALE